FFFQAEDGIRDYKVTGVQTCALPIWQIADAKHPRTGLRFRPRYETSGRELPRRGHPGAGFEPRPTGKRPPSLRRHRPRPLRTIRSEERRVGKVFRSRWWQYEQNIRDL